MPPKEQASSFSKWLRPLRENWPIIGVFVSAGLYQVDHDKEQDLKLSQILVTVSSIDARLTREESFRDRKASFTGPNGVYLSSVRPWPFEPKENRNRASSRGNVLDVLETVR